MSDSQAYEELSVSSEGITVVKRFEKDEFPVPAIAFEFASERDEPVTVRLSDSVPEAIEVEDLGFHPEYGSEYWTIDEDSIVFEREIEANADYTTVYGIRATGSDDVEQFLTEPDVEDVDPPMPEPEIPESDDEVIKEAISGDGDIPGLEEEEEKTEEENGAEAADGEDLTLELKDPNDPQEDNGDGGGGDGPANVGEGSVIATMAEEIRSKNVSADDVNVLRQAIEAVSGDSDDGGTANGGGMGSVVARVDQIQTDITDLRAYTAALEEFLDENGTGTQLIEDFESQLDEFSATLDSIETDVASHDDTLESLETLDSDIEALADDVESMTDDIEDVGTDVDDVTEELEEMADEVDEVSGEFGSVTDDIDALQEAVDGLEGDVEGIEDKVTDGDLGERIDDIEESLEDLQEWQEQIKATFGG